MNEIRVAISAGELLDKITILEIKLARIEDPAKLTNISTELASLANSRRDEIPPSAELERLVNDLRQVNEALWEIEDAIRICEKNRDFSQKFIDLARSVYIQNDRRATLKKEINELLGSTLTEEKSYEKYK